LVLWYALMAIGGFAFGLLGDRRPFGDILLFHPLVMFMTAAGAGLIVLRIALARPVPEIIPDRKLAFGLLIGWAAFLAGNFLATQFICTLIACVDGSFTNARRAEPRCECRAINGFARIIRQ
jgi:hypothetical protein